MSLTPHVRLGTEDSPRVLGAFACARTGRLPRLLETGPRLVTTLADARTVLTDTRMRLPFNVNRTRFTRTRAAQVADASRQAGPLPAAAVDAAMLVFRRELSAALEHTLKHAGGPGTGGSPGTPVDSLELLGAPMARAAVEALHPGLGTEQRNALADAALTWVDALGPIIAAVTPPRPWTQTRRRERRAHATLRRLLTQYAHVSEAACAPAAAALAAAVQVPVAAGAWLLNQLAHHPAVQDALARPGPGADPTRCPAAHPAADQPRVGARRRVLTLTGAVAWETVRLFPPSWLLPRVTTAPVTVADVPLPVGEMVLVSPLILGRDPQLVPRCPTVHGARIDETTGPARELLQDASEVDAADEDLARFAPERWLPGHVRPGAWLPFGAGPHACPGRGLALAELTHLAEVAALHRLAAPAEGTRLRDHRGLLPDPTYVTWATRPDA